MRARLFELDGLRGIAALIVVFAHYVGAFEVLSATLGQPAEGMPPLVRIAYAVPHLFVSGEEAVIVFFVLSGFVLALPFLRAERPTYHGYLIRRLFRIYVPYLVVTLLAAAFVIVLHPGGEPQLGTWFNSNWTHVPTWTDVRAIVLAWDAGATRVNGPVWSLEHEMRISLVFPLIALFVRRVSWRVSALAALWLMLKGDDVAGWFGIPYQIAASIQYSGLFIAGAAMAQHRAGLSRLFVRAGARGRVVLLACAVALYGSRFLFGENPLVGDVFVGFGACLLIACVLCDARAAEAVLSRVPQWLGRVSYSLYLTHLPVLLVLVYTLGRVVPAALVPVLAFPIALAVAELSYRWLERPAQELGRRLSRAPSRRVDHEPSSDWHTPKLQPEIGPA